MLPIGQHVGTALTYGLLVLAVFALWLPRRQLPPWLGVLVLACLSGAATGLVRWDGLLALAVFGGLAYLAKTRHAGPVKVLLLVLTGVMTLALSMHRFPGFVNPPLVSEFILSAHSPPFTHRLNFDTIAAGLILFGLFCQPARAREEWRAVARSYPVIIATPVLVLLAGLAVGFIGVDFKLLAYTPVFLMCNLLFTCVTEEAFFRGFMQEQLSKGLARWRAGPFIALGVAAILFGLAHARGGPVLIVLATVAGVGYSYAYLCSGRIEAAILTHFVLNGLHFVAFSYPRLV